MKKREMTPRDRILAAIGHQPVDALPTDFWGVAEITDALFKLFNVGDMKGLAQKLDMDKIMSVSPNLTASRNGMWDIDYIQVPLPGGAGYYNEPARFVLGGYETIGEIEENYVFPTTDMYDYSIIAEQCAGLEDYAIEGGYISLTYFYTILRGVEQMLLDFIMNPELARYIIYKLQTFSYDHVKKILEAGQGKIHITQVTDDFASQSGLLIGADMIEDFFGDYYRKNIELARSYGVHVFHHDDGAMTKMLPWLVDMGIEILNPLQWRLPGWDLPALKRDYGSRICFHGGVDNQYVLPFGTPGDVRSEVRYLTETLFADHTGFICAPCHNIQAITPVENILALYEAARPGIKFDI